MVSGASVVLGDNNSQGGKAVASAIQEKYNGRALFVPCDVRKETDVTAFVEAAVQRYGKLNGAFNNVGMPGDFVPLHEVDPETMLKIVDINLVGMMRLVRAQVTQMLHQGREAGPYSIVNTASTTAFQPPPTTSCYAATKAGVIAFSNAAAGAYGSTGIRINTVAPTAINGTPMIEAFRTSMPELFAKTEKEHPLKRVGELDDVAAAVEFLLSDNSKFITAQTLGVDGGFLNTSGIS